jgi:hypothetical protein
MLIKELVQISEEKSITLKYDPWLERVLVGAHVSINTKILTVMSKRYTLKTPKVISGIIVDGALKLTKPVEIVDGKILPINSIVTFFISPELIINKFPPIDSIIKQLLQLVKQNVGSFRKLGYIETIIASLEKAGVRSPELESIKKSLKSVREKMDKSAAVILADFLEWSGGFTPAESSDEELRDYADSAGTTDDSQEEILEILKHLQDS